MDIDSEPLQNARPFSPSPSRPLTLSQLLASVRQHASPLPPMPALPALHRGDVIEIQGPASSGKTHLLYHILLSALVPVAAPPRAEIAAVVYDTDAAFDIQRFRRLLSSRLSASVEGVLARLHLFRPTSLVQLAAAIAHLPAYHAAHMPTQDVAVLAIDSASAFYWPDRFSAEHLRSVQRPMALVLDALQRVRRSHAPLAVLTNWALKQHLHPFPVLEHDLGAKGLASSPFHLAHHLVLSSPPSSQSPAPPDDALPHETDHRKRITDSGQVHCLTRSSGTLDTVCFTLQITADDILVAPASVSETDRSLQ